MNIDALKILLLEEDETLADITSFRLELLGYQVQHVRSGEEALERIEQSLPDLVILDLYLPGMDGVELIHRLKNDERTSGLRLLAFSTDADLNTVSEAHAAGADDYLVTPYDPAVLQEKIANLVVKASR